MTNLATDVRVVKVTRLIARLQAHANLKASKAVERLTSDPVSVWTVDRGVFPDAVILEKHPLSEPSALDAGTDARRVRALSVKVLEDDSRRSDRHLALTARGAARSARR